jgi:hypothetical protein
MESATASAGHTGGISLLRLHSDERLARLAAAGNADAFEVLVRRYRAALIRAARRILPEDRAEDAVQQALLDATGRWPEAMIPIGSGPGCIGSLSTRR